MAENHEQEADLTTEWLRRVTIAGAAVFLAGSAGANLAEFVAYLGHPYIFLTKDGSDAAMRVLGKLASVHYVKDLGFYGGMSLSASIIGIRWATAFGWGARLKHRT